MPESPFLYYITSRAAFFGDERTRRHRLLNKIAEAASQGIDYIQIREKDMPTPELESLAHEAMQILRGQAVATGKRQPATALLINSRIDIALATQAAGVHLPADDVSPEDVRTAWKRGEGKSGAGTATREISRRDPLIAVSCHSPQEVTQAAANQATFAVFAPVFEKQDARGSIPTGLRSLHQACGAKIPVLALGGV